MQKLTIPTEVAEQLDSIDSPAELCDQTGTPRGVVLSLDLYRELVRDWNDRSFNEAELARARSETGGYTTVEAIDYVNKLIAAKDGR